MKLNKSAYLLQPAMVEAFDASFTTRPYVSKGFVVSSLVEFWTTAQPLFPRRALFGHEVSDVPGLLIERRLLCMRVEGTRSLQLVDADWPNR